MKKLNHILFIVLISSLFQSAFSQNRAFLNGGFESPVMDTATESNYFISANAPATFTDTRIKEWNTTASDYNVELRTYLPKTNKGEVSAIGNQHAEINATKVSRLYQNVCLINGESINYSFYHRGRKGYDDMEVNLYNAAGTTKMTVLKNSGDNNVAWKHYSDSYFVNVPSGVYQFSFESVSQSGSASEGNLLDDIRIGMAPLVTFSKATYSNLESGVEVPSIRVNGTVPAAGIVVTFSITGTSSAKEGEDYTLTKTITIPAGEYNTTSDSLPIPLSILNDGIVEPNETIAITIQSVSNGGFTAIGCGGASSLVYTIVNDDVLDAGPDQIVCPLDSVVFSAKGSLHPTWNKGVKQGVPFKTPTTSGTYTYTVYDTSYSAANLVVNGDFSNGMTGFTSNYVYDGRVDPTFTNYYLSEGTYNITTNPKLSNSSFFAFADHTGGTNRGMLIVNGSKTANTVFLSQTIPVKPNTLYTFSVWVSSSSGIDPAHIQFRVNGSPLGTPFMPPAAASWVQIKRSWNSGASTSAILHGISTDTVSNGNDFTIDDISFSPSDPFSDSLTITVKPAPTPITKDIDTCQKIGTYTLTAIGTNLLWYNDSLPATTGTAMAPLIDFNVPDTLAKWVSQITNGCESVRVKLNISIRVTPKAPETKDIDTCQKVGTHTLSVVGTNLKWYTVATGGIASTVAPSFDLNIPDTTSRWVSQTLNGCEGPRSQLDVAIKVTPTAPVTKDIDTCQKVGTHTLAVTGTLLKWYTVATGGTASTVSPSFDLNIPDTTSRWVSQTLNGCEGPRSQLDVAIRTTPLAPVTKNIDTCQRVGTHTLAVAGTNLKWYTIATGGTSSTVSPSFDLNIPNTTSRWVSQTLNGCEGPRSQLDITISVTPTAPFTKNIDTCQRVGTHTLAVTGTQLKWYTMATGGTATTVTPSFNLNFPDTTSRWVSQSTGGCESPRSQLDVVIKSSPTAPITKDIDTCQRVGTHALVASGTNLKWYSVDTGGFASTMSPSFNLNIPDTTSWWVSQTWNGCEGPRSQVKVAIKANPTAPVTRNIDTCQRAGILALTAVGSNLKWYTVPTGGIGSTTAPSFNLNVLDTTSRWVSQTINGCEGPRSLLDISIKLTLPAPITKNIDTCQRASSFMLTATGSQLKWYTSATDTPGSNTAPVFDLNIPDTTSRWVSQSSNGCEGPRSELKISIKTTPTAPVTENKDTCQKVGMYTLKAIGNNLSWYTLASGGTASTTAPAFDLNLPATTHNWVSQKLNGCEGPRSILTLTVKPLPAAPTVKDTSVCQKAGTLAFKATGTQLLWYTSGSTVGSAITPFVTTNTVATTTYLVSQTINGCEGPKATESIEIRPTPLAPIASHQELCQAAGTVSYIVSGTNLKWYTSSTATPFTTATPFVDRNVAGVFKAYASQTQNNCESPRKEVVITLNATPAAPAIPNVEYCLKALAKPLTTLTDSLFWYTVATGGTKSSVIPVPNTQVIGASNYWASAVRKGCEGPRTTVIATVHALPIVAITGTASGSYCAKSTLPLLATGATQYEWIFPSGALSSQTNATIASFSAADQGKYVLKGTDANQCSAKDSITLTSKNPPAVSATPVSVCEKAPISIQAKTTGTAYWKLPGNRIQNSSRLSLPVSTYADNGRYVVVSTQNGCTDSTELTITVVNCKPTARDDFYSIYTDEKLMMDSDHHPIHNDFDPNDKLVFQDLTFLTTPQYGQLSSDVNGFWTYKTNEDVEGREILEYQICDRGIPSLCATAKVEIEIKKRDAFFPDAFTPNGDGINDTYTVYHLSSHIKVDLSVFNRWGDLVYKNPDYQNTWKGTCEASACLGSELPVGTYFVVVQLSNGYKHTTYLTLSR